MGYNATPEVIKSIKREIERRHLSVAQVEQDLKEAGYPLGQTTIRRVLRKDSETKDSFRYEATIEPFWIVYMMPNAENKDVDLKTRLEDMEVLIAMKNDAIAEYRDRIKTLEKEHGDKCEECSKKQERWEKQIELKDGRIDRLCMHIEEQRAMMRKQQEQMDRMLSAIIPK